MTLRINGPILTAALFMVGGCMPAPVQEDAGNSGTTSTVVREETPAAQASTAPTPAAVPPAPVAAPIQVQPGPKNTQVSLMRVAVTGDVLTVQLTYRQEGSRYTIIRFPAKQVSVIDDQTSQRLSLLQDDQGQYL